MGTRADFYVGRGKGAEWLGSIAYDGHPDRIGKGVVGAETEAKFRAAVVKFLANREDCDATTPDLGWPWPWEDSCTTDYAYAFDGGAVYGCSFGREWFLAKNDEPHMEDDDGEPTEYGRRIKENGKTAVFPCMRDRMKVTYGPRSGLLILGMPSC